ATPATARSSSPTRPGRDSSPSCRRSHGPSHREAGGADLVLSRRPGDYKRNGADHRSSEATPMYDRIIETSLPAHDPRFPNPPALLPVPPEVAEFVARDEAECIRKHGSGYSPEARQRILDEIVLNWYYDSSYVAYRRTPQGVEVLAVCWEEANKYREEHP